MKKKIVFIFLMFLFITHLFGQAPQDVIKYNSFSLVSSQQNSLVNLAIRSPKLIITKMLGTPSAINRMQWETVNEDVDEYIYKGNSIYIDVAKDILWGFEIKNSEYCLNYYGKYIKIGDDIKGVVKRCFPLSFLSKYQNRITVPLSYKGEHDSYYLYFDYDLNDKIIEIGVDSY